MYFVSYFFPFITVIFIIVTMANLLQSSCIMLNKILSSEILSSISLCSSCSCWIALRVAYYNCTISNYKLWNVVICHACRCTTTIHCTSHTLHTLHTLRTHGINKVSSEYLLLFDPPQVGYVITINA